MNRTIKIIGGVLLTIVLQSCASSNTATTTIYPCSIGCGNDNITPPKGYVYYQNRVMSLKEFNHITNQHIVQE